MKKSIITSLLLGTLIWVPDSALANACHAKASALASQQGGKILRVQSQKSQGSIVCVVTLQVQRDTSKPPRIITRTVRP